MDETPEIKDDKYSKSPHSFYDIARRIMLAGIGAMAISIEEMEDFIDKLIERGELAKKEKEGLISELRERRKKFLHDEDDHIQKRMNEILNNLSIVTKKDMDDLAEKISTLEKKIDELTINKDITT